MSNIHYLPTAHLKPFVDPDGGKCCHPHCGKRIDVLKQGKVWVPEKEGSMHPSCFMKWLDGDADMEALMAEEPY